MRIELLNVALRTRSNWEALELGTALSRRHARAVWGSWLLASAPLFVLFNALAWWLDAFGWALLLLWWCTPLFERAPLYVLSRGIFGEPVTALQALRAQRHWGGTGFWGYLGWRRPSVLRSVCLPVNLLEGTEPRLRAQRRRAVVAGAGGSALVLSLAGLAFQAVLVIGSIALLFLFVPLELMSDSWRAAWELARQDTPHWMRLGLNTLCWLAAALVGPLQVGAGFGLYLNRRTQMEAWDVEIGLRRLRERLLRSSASLAVLLALLLPLAPLRAQPALPADGAPAAVTDDAADTQDGPAPGFDDDPGNTPAVIFGDPPVDTAGFRQAVQRAYEDPLQSPTRTTTRWKARQEGSTDAKQDKRLDSRGDGSSRTAHSGPVSWVARIAEWGLWALLGMVALIVLATAPRWLRWLRGSGRRVAAAPAVIHEDTLVLPDVLPPDVATQAGRLWQDGRPRQALALLYRASVQTVAERSGVLLPPGATEAQCLRAARRMPDADDRELFTRVVRMWQYAAYAGRLPDADAFQALAGALQQRYRWQA
ncbi:DUF4129 domain-containing protein [Stenotrophomonas sp. 24(2023)]|uniref:DUF4129 domain-containing protein n=1 Tax=Stenotrophomonas sp. 24(2023) TaxID=3068324 RepID=UPI0027DFFCD2|nr:DUF4129 domain-containing protein [Stenotrophomonas sp. 24(2023)]WMJ70910.1 DUF4129 domain-containing protein [Stenotrophomonas sp. 24(2023)]